MRLADLDPWFLIYGERPARGKFVKDGIPLDKGDWTDDDLEERDFMQRFSTRIETLAEAQGIWFDCPKCHAIGESHGVDVSFADRGIPDHLGTHNGAGQPVRWTVTGTGFSDLTTTPSILLQGGCEWHGFITDGDVS